MKKRIKSQFTCVNDYKDLLWALKKCSNDDLLLIMAFCEIIYDDRIDEVEDV